MGALRREAAYPPCCEAGVVFVMTCDFPSFESKSTCKMYKYKKKKEDFNRLWKLWNNVAFLSMWDAFTFTIFLQTKIYKISYSLPICCVTSIISLPKSLNK